MIIDNIIWKSLKYCLVDGNYLQRLYCLSRVWPQEIRDQNLNEKGVLSPIQLWLDRQGIETNILNFFGNTVFQRLISDFTQTQPIITVDKERKTRDVRHKFERQRVDTHTRTWYSMEKSYMKTLISNGLLTKNGLSN